MGKSNRKHRTARVPRNCRSIKQNSSGGHNNSLKHMMSHNTQRTASALTHILTQLTYNGRASGMIIIHCGSPKKREPTDMTAFSACIGYLQWWLWELNGSAWKGEECGKKVTAWLPSARHITTTFPELFLCFKTLIILCRKAGDVYVHGHDGRWPWCSFLSDGGISSYSATKALWW